MTDTVTPIEDLNSLSDQVTEPLPDNLSLDLIDAMIEKSRDQKVTVQELQILIARKYTYRAAAHGKIKISQNKWNKIRALSNRILVAMDRRIALLGQLRDRLSGG